MRALGGALPHRSRAARPGRASRRGPTPSRTATPADSLVPAVASGLWVGGSVERKSHQLWDRAVGAAVHLDQEDPRSFTIRKPDGCEPQSEAVVDLAHDQLDMRAAVGNGHQPTDLGGGSGHHEVRKVVGAPTPLVDPLPRIQSGAPEALPGHAAVTVEELELFDGDRRVAWQGFGGPALYPGQRVHEWRGRTDDLPYFVIARALSLIPI